MSKNEEMMNYPIQWTMLRNNRIQEDICREYFFKLVDEYYRASNDTIETLEKYFLNETITVFEITEEVFEYAILNTNIDKESSNVSLNKIRNLCSKGNFEFRFPRAVKPLDIDEVLLSEDKPTQTSWIEIDGLLAAFDNYKDYAIKTYGEDQFDEIEPNDSETGCFTIIPLNKRSSVLGSNHIWGLTEDFKIDYGYNDRETYGNLFDIALFLYFEIMTGSLDKTDGVDAFGNSVSTIRLPTTKIDTLATIQ